MADDWIREAIANHASPQRDVFNAAQNAEAARQSALAAALRAFFLELNTAADAVVATHNALSPVTRLSKVATVPERRLELIVVSSSPFSERCELESDVVGGVIRVTSVLRAYPGTVGTRSNRPVRLDDDGNLLVDDAAVSAEAFLRSAIADWLAHIL